MAEIQKTDSHSSAMVQRFVEFIMLQAQQAMLCLGRLPHPTTGETTVNLEAARMFIDHLELLREKTQGNLSKEEETILNNILAELQMNFVQVQGGAAGASVAAPVEASFKEPSSVESVSTTEDKKKFSKSYGA